MPATWTQADVDALKLAIKTGVLEVEYEGPPRRRIRYQTLQEMLTLLSLMQQSVTGAAGGVSYKLGATRKGFYS